MSLKVILVDDHQIMRQGLKSLLRGQADITVVAEASDGRTAVALVREHLPDLVVMDITMPDLNGIEATRQISLASSQTRVIGLSGHADQRHASEMLRAGARGYIIKDSVIDEVLDAIRAVMEGKIYLSAKVASAMPHNGSSEGSAMVPSAFVRLSPREREVLQLIAEGRATKEVASMLKVSVKTVETHRRQIMEKLHLYSVAELTKYAIAEGITSSTL